MRHALFIDRWIVRVFSLVTVMLLSACMTVEPTRIQLDRSVHFVTPDGNDVVVGPGAYRVEQATGSQLRVFPAGDAPPILLGARAVSSDLDVPGPVAMAVPFKPDAYDLLLLLPGRQALEAHGSVSGVQSRFAEIKLPSNIPMTLGPDLVGCKVWGRSSWGLATYYAVVKNQGVVVAGPSKARIGDSAPFDIPALEPGTDWVRNMGITDALIYVDVENAVAEMFENNNTGNWCQ